MASDSDMSSSSHLAITAALVQRLTDLADSLESEVKKGHKFHFVSQVQSGAVERGIHELGISGSKPASAPQFKEAEWRAAAYNQASSLAELEAFAKLSKVAIFELAKASAVGFRSDSALVPLTLVRGLVERVALCAWLIAALKNLPPDPGPPSNGMEAVHMVSPAIAKAVYGTRLNWPKLADIDLRKANPKELQYVQREMRADLSAAGVLSMVDKLDKRVAGARLSYEILCEFLHPNVGDLYATTVESNVTHDIHGTRHYYRIIGTGAKTLAGQSGELAIQTNVLEICSDIVGLVPTLFDELTKILAIVTNRTRRFAHEMYWSRQFRFRKDDLCPCFSGLTARKCAAKDKPLARINR